MARWTSQGVVDGGYIWDCSARFAAHRGFGEEQPRPATREVPFTEGRMVLYATRPKTLSPADPCNKVSGKPFQPAGRKTTPSSVSPVVTKRQSAMSSLRARATIIVLRVPTRLSAVRARYHNASALAF